MPPRDLHKENQTSLPVKGKSFITSYEKMPRNLTLTTGMLPSGPCMDK